MTVKPTAPAPLDRPKFARFIWERGLDYRAAGRHLGRTGEWVRLVCLPFNDARRRIPDGDDVAKISDWSEGEIGPSDWYPARLTDRSDLPVAANAS